MYSIHYAVYYPTIKHRLAARAKKAFVVKRVEGTSKYLTKRDAFAWFVLHAEAGSGVVRGSKFKVQ